MRSAALLLLVCCACRAVPDAEACRAAAEERRQHGALSSAQVLHALGPEGICWREGGYALSYDCGDRYVEFEFDDKGACTGASTGAALRTEAGVIPSLFTVHSRTPAFDVPSGTEPTQISCARLDALEPTRKQAGNWHVSQGLSYLGSAGSIEWRADGLVLRARCEDGRNAELEFGRDGMMIGPARITSAR